MSDFRGRSLLTLADYSPEEITELLEVAKKYKALKKAGTPHREHEGKSIALLFEKKLHPDALRICGCGCRLRYSPRVFG